MHPNRKKSPSQDSSFTVQQGALMAVLFVVLAVTLQAAPPAWWTATGGPLNSNPANDYYVANQGQLKRFTADAVRYFDTNLPGGAGPTLHSMVDGWSNYYATNGYSSTNPAPQDFKAINQGQLKTIANLVYAQLASEGYTGLTLPNLQANTNTDYMLVNGGQLKNVFNFDLSVVPGAITGLNATTSNAGEIDLSWTVPAPNNASSETIEQSTDGGTTWTTVAVVDATLNSYAVTSLDPTQSYKFRVKNTNGTGSSTPDVTSSSSTPIPQSPSDLTGQLDDSGNMKLSWATAPGATSYKISRELLDGSGTWTNLDTTSSTDYTDLHRDAYMGYRYTVSAVNSGGTNHMASAVFPQPRYAVIDLGTNVTPYAINNAGMVAFSSSSGVGVWTNGTPVYAPTNFNAYTSGGISTNGQIVGSVNQDTNYYNTESVYPYADQLDPYTNAITIPAIWSPQGGIVSTPVNKATVTGTVLSSYYIQIDATGTAISPAGNITGSMTVSEVEYQPPFMGADIYFLKANTQINGGFTYAPFGFPGGLYNFNPIAINDSNQIVDGGSDDEGYISGGTYHSLSFAPKDINNAGLIAGYNTITGRGILYDTSTSITTTLGDYFAIKINNASPRQILDNGDQLWTYDSTNSIYKPINIPDYMADSAWSGLNVASMNDNGAIVGTATKAGVSHGVLAYLNYITRDGHEINSTNNTVVVGQQICLTNVISGIPTNGITYQWHIPRANGTTNDTAFYDYKPYSTDDFEAYARSNFTNLLTPIDYTTNSFCNFYWSDGGTNRVVTCDEVISGQTNTVSTTLNVVRPIIQAFGAAQGPIVANTDYPRSANGIPWLHFGDVEPHPGVYFLTSDPDTLANSGDLEWVQIVNLVSITDTTSTITTNSISSGLDTSFPYGTDNVGGTSDSPGTKLYTNTTSVNMTFNATMYLMWRCTNSTIVNGDQTVYVPLKKFDWNWNGTATNASPTTNNGTGWGIQSAVSNVALSEDATNEPIWTTNVKYNFYPPRPNW